jgi:hypothetical protein
VLPNFAFFGTMSFLTELALGVGLLFGFMTRLAGLGGFVWQINIAIGSFNVPGEWYWIWPLLTLPQFCFAFGNAGRVLGIDGWITPVLESHEQEGAAWARVLRHAT